MDRQELIDISEYKSFLKDCESLNILYILIVEFTLTLILLVSSFRLVILFDLMIAYVVLIFYLYFRRKLNNLRNLNSRSSINGNIRFNKDYLFSLPATRNFFGDELPGTIYFNRDKLTFIANRVIGLQLVWFNLNRVVKGYYDLNFLPESFKTRIKLRKRPITSRFIFNKNSAKIIVVEKRLYITKIYKFSIPINSEIFNAINSLKYIK